VIGSAIGYVLLASAVVGLGVPASAGVGPSVTAPAPVFRFTFERPPQRNGGVVRFPARGGLSGRVLSADGGRVRRRTGPNGWFARFPGACQGAGCPRAVLGVPDRRRLDPAGAAFSFGARVLMRPGETTHGSNLLQKGRFHTSGGQWKLQVDDRAGHPSCLLRGSVGGRSGRTVLLESPVTVADGRWHQVRCVRRAHVVAVVVDGKAVRRRVSVPTIANRSPVRIGGPGARGGDDQFHGRLDDVFLTIRG
jgi:hypothetical protein